MKEYAMSLDHEVSHHPQLLFNPTLSVQDLWFCGHRLGDPAHSINVERIRAVSMMPFPAGATRQIYKDNKTYYVIDDQRIEYPLAAQITAACSDDGWLHTREGVRYRIREGRIVEIGITPPLLAYYQTIPKADIQARFRLADRVIEKYNDDGLSMTDFVYHERMLRIHYRDEDSRIETINLGETLIDWATMDSTLFRL